MRSTAVPRALPADLDGSDRDAVVAWICSEVDRAPAVDDAIWLVGPDHAEVFDQRGPPDPARDAWGAALLRLSEPAGLRWRLRTGEIDEDGRRSAVVLQWGPGERWLVASRPTAAADWETVEGEGFDAVRPALRRWVDAGTRGLTRMDQLAGHLRRKPPIRRDAITLPFEPVRNAARLAEQVGALFDGTIVRDGLDLRVVVLIRGRRATLWELDLDVVVPLDDFVRTVAATAQAVSVAVVEPERHAVEHVARMRVESGGRRAERTLRIARDDAGRACPSATVAELGKVRGDGWIGVAPRARIDLADLGRTPGLDDD